MREKLIELLYEAEGLVNNELPTIEMVADHLIANGVTFATDNNVGGKWIPVSERLPEQMKPVLAFSNCLGCYDMIEAARWTGNRWEATWDHEEYFAVTHWMPLPSTEGLN